MLQSMGLQSVEHDLANEQRFTHFYGGFAYSLYFFKINYQHPSTQNHNVSCIPTLFSRLISPLDINEL